MWIVADRVYVPFEKWNFEEAFAINWRMRLQAQRIRLSYSVMQLINMFSSFVRCGFFTFAKRIKCCRLLIREKEKEERKRKTGRMREWYTLTKCSCIYDYIRQKNLFLKKSKIFVYVFNKNTNCIYIICFFLKKLL